MEQPEENPSKLHPVESLQDVCCNTIAHYDNVEILQPIVGILPIEIVEKFLATFDVFQIGQFRKYYPKRAKETILFIGKFKRLCNELKSIVIKRRDYFRKDNELEYYELRYWAGRVMLALMDYPGTYSSMLEKIYTTIPHLVVYLDLANVKCSDQLCSVLPHFTHIKCISIDIVGGDRIISLAKKWKFLKEIKLRSSRSSICVKSLAQFLQFKISKGESVVLTIIENCLTLRQFFELGESMHGLSGIKFYHCNSSDDEELWLEAYSKVARIEKLTLMGTYGSCTFLMDIIQHAPAYTSDEFALSKLHLERVQFSPYDFQAFQHWRFSRLAHFHLSDVKIGHDGAALLAKHAVFWPFMKQFILHNCKVPGNGFLLLLPAMHQGHGCQHLLELDFGSNIGHESALQALGEMLSSQNLTKLKILLLFDLPYPHALRSFPAPFLIGIMKNPLVHLDMGFIALNLEQVYELFRNLFSISDNSLRVLSLLDQKWHSGNKNQLQLNLQKFLQDKIAEDMLQIEQVGMTLKFRINRAA